MGPEAKIERYFCQRAVELGVYVRKFVSPGNRGVPDRLVISPEGEVFFIEFKAPNGVLSKYQHLEISRIELNKVKVHIVDSLEKALEVLGEYS